MRNLRRASQILFLGLFFLLFLFASYPLTTGIPVDLFLRLDPLEAFVVSMATRHPVIRYWPALILLVATVVFGRFFCGWICPLGTSIDGFDRWHRNRFGRESTSRHTRWKFGILVAVLVASLFTVQIAGWLDPISLFTRTVTTSLYPFFAWIVDGVFGLFLGISVLEGALYSFQNSLRGSLLPVQTVAFSKGVGIGLMFFTILALGWQYRRFWCRNLCPLGALLGVCSLKRWNRRKVDESCTQCGICRAKCRMDAIAPDFRNTNHVECISCMDCRHVCPAGAVDFGFVKNPRATKIDWSRRRFIASGVAGVIAAGLLKTSWTDSGPQGRAIRPPGAVDEPKFLGRCVRCGECIRICSTAGAGLHHAGLESGFSGLLTPVLLPRSGYCEYNCNLCGKVCPSGAIRSLSLEAKQKLKMGTAHFDKTRCIPWYYGENCMVCEEHCPTPEKAIRFREEKVLTIDGKPSTVLLPYVDEALCIGCGICETRCPVEGERGIFVDRSGEQRQTS